MNMKIENQYAEFMLRLLLKQGDRSLSDHPLLKDLHWDVFLELARKNRIIIRVYDRLLAQEAQLSEVYEKAVNDEKMRIGRVIEMMGKVVKICEDMGVDFLFLKNYQHYPDMGEDIDLLVMDYTDAIDLAVIDKLCARLCKLSLLNRMGGKTQYYIDGCSSNLEILHGRIGRLGERMIFPRLLMKNRKLVFIDGVCVPVPSLDDQLIVQVLQSVYSHFYLRISEIVYWVSAIIRGQLNWDYIVKTTQMIGIFEGLRYCLSYVNMVYKNIWGESLPINNPKLLNQDSEIKVSFSGFHYRLPSVTIGARLYAKKFFSDIWALNWVEAGRLCVALLFAMVEELKALAQWQVVAPTTWFRRN